MCMYVCMFGLVFWRASNEKRRSPHQSKQIYRFLYNLNIDCLLFFRIQFLHSICECLIAESNEKY